MPIIVSQEDEHIHRVPDTWNFRVILPINPSCRISIAEVYPIRLPNCLQHKVLERQHFGMTRDNVLPTFVRENNLQPGWVLNIVRHSVSTRVVVISLEPHTQFQHSSIEESIQRRFIRGTLTGTFRDRQRLLNDLVVSSSLPWKNRVRPRSIGSFHPCPWSSWIALAPIPSGSCYGEPLLLDSASR